MAAAVGTAPRDREESKSEQSETPPPPPRADGAGNAEPLTFDARSGKPVERTVKPGTHVIVTVPVEESGEIRIDSLGLVDSAEPRSPAVFDILTGERGRFPIAFDPPTGSNEPVGTLVVR
ncbi:MAG: hypothetical protein H0V29_00050 [Thermoleophilaceae bacterium]|nr:hypothetical protein [Thermoleophilaceae bacterium]